MGEKREVSTNSRKALKFRGAECLNCGQPLDLSDRYCPYCSQLNSTKNLSLSDFFREFIGGIVAYDSRLRYTLKHLLFKPGTITKNYVEGKRMTYANPFRFFLSVSLIYFIVQGLFSAFSSDSNNFNVNLPDEEEMAQVEKFKELGDQNPTKINALMVDSIVKSVREDVEKRRDSVNKIEDEKEYEYISEKDLDTLNWANRVGKRFFLYHEFYEATEIKNPTIALDSLNHHNTAYNRWVYGKGISIKKIKEEPAQFIGYLSKKIPFFLFFFTPLFALFFWLIYSKKKYTYMEHMIFIFHIFSFVFLAALICLLPDLLIGSDIFASICILLIGPFYFYKALRNFYRQNRLVTIIKFIFLNIVFWIGSTFFALIFFLITAAMY